MSASTTSVASAGSVGYSRRQVYTILSGLLLASFVAALDTTVVATAMYRIGVSLNGLTAQAWVTTAFLITSTISVPVYGKLSDTHGRKPLFLVAIAVFLGGSVLCAFAPSMPVLAAFRAVQGIGAGGMLALTSAVMGDILPPRERAKYGAYFVGSYAVASVAGPVTGGALAGQQTLLGLDGWRWIFLLNLPVGVAACVVVGRVLRSGTGTGTGTEANVGTSAGTDNRPRRRRRVDVLGTLALALGAVPLLLIAQRGQAWGWAAPGSMVCYVVGGVGVIGFLLAERRAGDSALLTLRLLRNRGFAVGAGQSLVSMLGLYGSVLLVPLYLQLVRGYSPTDAGLLTLPQVAATLAGSVIAGQYTSRTGRYKILPVTGSILMLAGMLLLCRLAPGSSLAHIETALVLLGVGSTLYARTITLSMQNALPRGDLGVATSSNSFFRQIGGTIGAAASLSIAYSAAAGAIRTDYGAASQSPAFLAALNRHPGEDKALGAAARAGQSALDNTGFLQGLDPVLAQPFKQGFTSAFDTAFVAGAVVMTGALALALRIKELPLRTIT